MKADASPESKDHKTVLLKDKENYLEFTHRPILYDSPGFLEKVFSNSLIIHEIKQRKSQP